MKRAIISFVGILLIATALAGIPISALGIVGLWRIETQFKTGAEETLALLDSALQTTSDGLNVAFRSLEQAENALVSLGGHSDHRKFR